MSTLRDRVTAAAAGRWSDILAQLGGVPEEFLVVSKTKESPCPNCGGNTRYRFDDRHGSGDWFCSHCGGKDHQGGGGTGFDLLMRMKGWIFSEALRAVAQYLGVADDWRSPTTFNSAEWDGFWRYSDEFVVVRRNRDTVNSKGKRDKDVYPYHWNGQRWERKRPDPLLPLYNRDDLLRRRDAPVLVVEGEKTADAAIALFPELVVTTWYGGTNSIKAADWSLLRGRAIYLWPDADADGKGLKAMKEVAQAAPASEFHLVEPPEGVPDTWDLADAVADGWYTARAMDWLLQHSSLHEVEKPAAADHAAEEQDVGTAEPARTYAELLDLLLTAIEGGDISREMELRHEVAMRFRSTTLSQVNAHLFQALSRREQPSTDEIQEDEDGLDMSRVTGLDYLIDGFVAANDLTMISGEAGAGKTLAALEMAIAVIEGTGFLDRETKAIPGKVLFIASDSGAAPLKAAMQDLGIDEHPAVLSGPSRRLFVWADDAAQKAKAWAADVRGCMKLLQFVKKRGIDLVVIDSAKAVTAKADISYTDNPAVTSLLTFLKESVCSYTSIVILNHDGMQRGTHAGAKAWAEIPSVVHHISTPKNDEGNVDHRRREWQVRKDRIAPIRSFQYELDPSSGHLKPCADVEVARDCQEAILTVLRDAYTNGVKSLSRAALVDEVMHRFDYSRGSVANKLSTMPRAKHPQISRCSHPRGHFRLAPRLVDNLDSSTRARARVKSHQVESELNASKPLPTQDLNHFTSISQVKGGDEDPSPGGFTRENEVNSLKSSPGAGSEDFHSQRDGSDRVCAREANAADPPGDIPLLEVDLSSEDEGPEALRVLDLRPVPSLLKPPGGDRPAPATAPLDAVDSGREGRGPEALRAQGLSPANSQVDLAPVPDWGLTDAQLESACQVVKANPSDLPFTLELKLEAAGVRLSRSRVRELVAWVRRASA